MLFSGSIHACMSVGTTIEFTHYWDDNWQDQCFITTGILSFALAAILGITSLPSVTDILSWKEFAFIQSKLGWLCLCFGTAHDLFPGFRYIFIEPPILCGFF